MKRVLLILAVVSSVMMVNAQGGASGGRHVDGGNSSGGRLEGGNGSGGCFAAGGHDIGGLHAMLCCDGFDRIGNGKAKCEDGPDTINA